ncbi:MAG: hypothetical protein CVT93_07120 [Bacteroidetes bacterium HGW-Bacteroidetes-10]|nr:MAG: hypothetical protein CVT93_07120 [Bacteroidetes bacterium HGW-Bacteroidetes-10]
MNTLKYYLYLLTAVALFASCSSGKEPAEPESELVEITGEQFVNDKMLLGEMESVTFEDVVKCSGTIVPVPNGMATVSTPVPGVIKAIHCHSGQMVERNMPLMEISGNEVIDIQRDFAEASANFNRAKSDFERIESLYKENITSKREFLLIESELKSSSAKYNGLRLRIESMGLSAAKVEAGDFYASYIVRSPIGGYVSALKANIGSYTDSRAELIEIVNPAMFQLRMMVFATDIEKIKKGQSVRFKSANSDIERMATVTSVGVRVDNDSKSIECFASVADKKQVNPVAYEFVECEAVTSSSLVDALPDDALIKTDSGHSVLLLEKQEKGIYLFSKKEIQTGRQFNGYTEILSGRIEGQMIVKGSYNIQL